MSTVDHVHILQGAQRACGRKLKKEKKKKKKNTIIDLASKCNYGYVEHICR